MSGFELPSDSPKIVIPAVRDGYHLVSLGRARRHLVQAFESYCLETAYQLGPGEDMAICNDDAFEYIDEHLTGAEHMYPDSWIEASGASIFLVGDNDDVKIRPLQGWRLQGRIASLAIGVTVLQAETNRFLDDAEQNAVHGVYRATPLGLHLAIHDAVLLDKHLRPHETFPLVALPLTPDALHLSEIVVTDP